MWGEARYLPAMTCIIISTIHCQKSSCFNCPTLCQACLSYEWDSGWQLSNWGWYASWIYALQWFCGSAERVLLFLWHDAWQSCGSIPTHAFIFYIIITAAITAFLWNLSGMYIPLEFHGIWLEFPWKQFWQAPGFHWIPTISTRFHWNSMELETEMAPQEWYHVHSLQRSCWMEGLLFIRQKISFYTMEIGCGNKSLKGGFLTLWS